MFVGTMMHFLKSLLQQGPLLLLHTLIWVQSIGALPASAPNTTLSNVPIDGKNVPLKILPLGNSITFGFQSTDGNGYRKVLLDMITANGTAAQYIGSVRAGNMTDNYNEGHPGAIITQITNFSRASLPLRPNIILLMAGTNDMNFNLSAGAPERLGNLIDMCVSACPDAVILIAQLTPAATPSVEKRIEEFNPSVVSLVARRARNGTKIAAIDMPAHVTLADLKDGLHPNDHGYGRMAEAWYGGIQEVASKGWITPPMPGTDALRDIGPTRGANSTTVIPLAVENYADWSIGGQSGSIFSLLGVVVAWAVFGEF